MHATYFEDQEPFHAHGNHGVSQIAARSYKAVSEAEWLSHFARYFSFARLIVSDLKCCTIITWQCCTSSANVNSQPYHSTSFLRRSRKIEDPAPRWQKSRDLH